MKTYIKFLTYSFLNSFLNIFLIMFSLVFVFNILKEIEFLMMQMDQLFIQCIYLF